MKILQMIREESTVSLPWLVVLACIAGMANALVLAIINAAAAKAENQAVSFWYFALFTIVVTVWNVAQRHVMITSAEEMEQVLHKIRIRLADKVRHSDLKSFERIGRAEIYTAIQKNTQTISQATLNVLDGAQSALLVLFTASYVAWLSLPAFLLTVAFMWLAVSIYFQRRRQLRSLMRKAAAKENQLFTILGGLLDGFKAVRIHAARSADLFSHMREVSSETTALRMETRHRTTGQFIYAQTSFFLLLATIVFIVPRFSPTYTDVVVKTTTAILFLIGPVGSLVGSMPTLSEANGAAESIYELEARLDQTSYRPPRPDQAWASFREIRLEGVTFSYEDDKGAPTFMVGPLDLTVRPGELIFIAGGNGTGKSTLLKLLTALYLPQSGSLRLDGQMINNENREEYLSLFAAIFSDFHLFRRLYGIRAVSPQQVEDLLELLDLTGKTHLVDGELDTLDLSGGQRKRLALLVSFLEDRPIFVFDEWAADQDPLFRRKFYEELLPMLKERGKTIIAVTHDDRYFEVADRLLVMREGRLEESTR
jgi:putative ATP-binding cassette transporter